MLMAFRPQEGEVLDWYERAVAAAADGDRQVPVLTIRLTPLTDDDSRELVENLLRVENLPAATRRTILKKAEGNPFFLEELLRSLIDSGLLIVEGDRVVATEGVEDLQVPDTVQGVIAARIDRLPTDDKHTLQTAAVIGRVFQEAVLSWLVEREHVCEDLGGRLAELQRRELVRRRTDLELIFKHAITQDVTYHSLLLARRQELHRVTAEAIEALFPDRLAELSGTLAHHYGQAGAPGRGAAVSDRRRRARRGDVLQRRGDRLLQIRPRGGDGRRAAGHGEAAREPRRPADDERRARSGPRGVPGGARHHRAGRRGRPGPPPPPHGQDVRRRAALRRGHR